MKNYYPSKRGSQTIMEAYSLMEYFEHNSDIRIHSWEVPFDRNIILYDISLYSKGIEEEELYLRNPQYRQNIRSGNTVIQIVDNKKNPLVTFFGRKGLRKIFMINKKILDLNLESINNNEFEIKSRKGDFELIKRDCIFNKIERTLKNSESKIILWKASKENGENCQISWIENCKSWLIASKNVSILVRDKKDIELYNRERFNYAKLIAEKWFEIINKSIESGKEIDSLKSFLIKHTLIGDFCGNIILIFLNIIISRII